MPLHECEAVVLRQYPFSEADLVVVLFSREHGKVRALARGVKRPKSRLGGTLELLNRVQLRYWLKDGAELGRVVECETLHSYLGRTSSLERIYAFSYVAELTDELAQESNPAPLLFRLLLSTLDAAEGGAPLPLLLRYFELWALRLSGLLPDHGYCSSCGRCVKEEGFFAVPDTGLARCRNCSHESGLRVRPEAARLIGKISEQSPAQFASAALPREEARDLERLTQRLLELHLEKKLRSYRLLREVREGE